MQCKVDNIHGECTCRVHELYEREILETTDTTTTTRSAESAQKVDIVTVCP